MLSLFFLPHHILILLQVCHILTHISDNQITFDIGPSGSTWTPTIPKGSQYEFNETIWGPITRRYLEAIRNIPDEAFAGIVAEAHNFVKKAPTASAVDLSDDDSKFENIASFR